MRYLVNSEEMKRCDRRTIETIGMPGMVLMERAALSVAEELINGHYDLYRTLVVCGTGNNGGDGLAVARLLHLKGYKVHLAFIGQLENCSPQMKQQMKILDNYDIPFFNNFPEHEYTTIVDAIFGVGLNRMVEGDYIQWIEKINESDAKIVSVDIPSGVSSDTGEVFGSAVKAHTTVTMSYYKIGMLLYPGADYAGKIIVKDIGITDLGFGGNFPHLYTYDTEDLKRMPKRCNDSNKGTYGKVLVIAGSFNMNGAAYLAAKAAYSAGAGLVRIYTPLENREILQTLLPEAIVTTYERFHMDLNVLRSAIAWADVIGMGPGIGKSIDAKSILNVLLNTATVPVVLDADGINLLADHVDYLVDHEQEIILTPHIGEMSRLLGKDREDIKKNLIQEAEEFAQKYHVVCVLKDSRTVVSDGSGLNYINLSGNNGMATGGAGDVLAGIITGLLAQKSKPMEAAALGVYIHGLAGNLAAEKKGYYALMANDIIDYIGKVI